MAIALRAYGSTVAHDVGTGNPTTVPTPAGVVAGDYLLMFITYDSNIQAGTPSGWTQIIFSNPGVSGLYATPKTTVYGRVADGTEGTGVNISYSTGPWPNGSPYVIGVMGAYTGVNTAGPIEVSLESHGYGPQAATQAHPQATTGAGDWLITVRSGSDVSTFTCTNSVGTDVARATATGFSELTMAVFDSNTATSAGAQTQRSTTLSGAPGQGTCMLTLAIRPASAAGATTALAQVANVNAAAPGATAAATAGSWTGLCSTNQLPIYTWAIDWAQSGFSAGGTILNTNAFLDTGDLTGWGFTNCTSTYAKVSLGLRTLPTAHIVPNGSSASGGLNSNPHTAVGSITPGNSYIVDCWVYSPNGWTDLRACVDWYDATDTFLSTGLGSGTSVAAGTWTHLVQTLVAPASASRGSPRARYGSTPPSSADYYVWGLFLADPSLPNDPRMAPDATAVIQSDLLSSDLTYVYGRDQMRPLSPAAIGSGQFSLTNVNRVYSPENTNSALYGNLDAARPVRGQVVFAGSVYSIFSGYLNDYNVTATRQQRDVGFSMQDALSIAQNTTLTTQLYQGIRTGTAIGIILDAIGWTGGRDIDPGGTIMPYWWLSGTKVPDAINDLVLSEGTPAIAYPGPDGTFVFRDRHHRLLRSQSTTVQASFGAQRLGDCTAPAVTGISFSEPFVYAHGWKDIVNYCSFSVGQRSISGALSTVWQYGSGSSILVSNGATVTITATTSDPFIGAIPPDPAAGDFTLVSGSSVTATLSRTSGQATDIQLTATGGDAVISGLQLRAYAIPVTQTVIVSAQDSGSITQHGQQTYPNQAPWADAQDAAAVASLVVARYAQRRPTVQMRVDSSDPQHYTHVIGRALSDLINIQNDEMLINNQFFVEKISGTISRQNQSSLPPVHYVVLGCEMNVSGVVNPFTFDLRGAGFDNGQFAAGGDSASNVFVFDDPVRGQFNVGLLGT